MTTVLITGAAGFVGSHLVDALLQDSTISIAGLLHPSQPVQYFRERERLTVYRQDILDSAGLTEMIRQVSPDVVYHLAGMAHVHESWTSRRATIETNFMGTFHLLEACRALPVFPKVLLIGSGECYGVVPEKEQPIDESRPLAPASPYAVSKIAQEMLGIQYGRAEGLPVFISRSFNHTGPRQKETFVCSAFAMQIARAENGLSNPEIHVGNLTARRDFSDVRDVVNAYLTLIQNGRPGEPYNVCSGIAVSIQEILDILLSHSTKKFHVVTDPEKFRPVDMPLLLGNPEKVQTEAGWKPRFELSQTLLDLLNYWRARVA